MCSVKSFALPSTWMIHTHGNVFIKILSFFLGFCHMQNTIYDAFCMCTVVFN